MIASPGTAYHFLASDLLGIAAGFALFSLMAFFPGYAIGWLTNAFRFRERLLPFRLAASVPLSLAIGPILAYTVGCGFGWNGVWMAYALLFAAALLSGALGRGAKPLAGFDPRRMWPFAAFVAVWLAVAFLSLADLPLGRRLYYSVIDFDYALRIAFTHSIGAFGLPARTPFFFSGHAAALRYHYFWMIPCAMINRLGSPLVDARQAFIAGTMWVGIGMISMVPLYLRLFLSASRDVLLRCRVGIALLAVTGLDIIPALMMVQLYRIGLIGGISPSVEWWNEQLDGWFYTMLWEPHYTCALVACLTGFLVVWSLPPQATRPQRAVCSLLAGVALATAAGCGIYVAGLFAVFLGCWMAAVLIRRKWLEAGTLAVAGAAALLLALPFFASLRESFSQGPVRHLVAITVRSFVPVELALRILGLDRPWQLRTGDFLCLPLNYFVELGVFFLAGWLFWRRFRERRQPATPAELAMFLMAASGMLVCSFVGSAIITNNDLAWRGTLPTQFVLLLCAADVLAERASRARLVRLAIVLGLAGTVYDLAILRFYPVLSDAGKVPPLAWMGSDRLLGWRTAANREAYEWLRARTPETAVVQQYPEPFIEDVYSGAYGQRQAAAMGGDCTAVFGGDSRECAALMRPLSGLFAAGSGTDALASVCRSLPIDVIVARDTDAAWRDRDSWVWTGDPIYHNDFVRLFACHPR